MGALPQEHTTCLPLEARKSARPSMEPSASGSGFTWHARATDGARSRRPAARSNASSSGSLTGGPFLLAIGRFGRGFLRRRRLLADLLEQLRHPLHLGQPDVLLELELRCELEPDLLAQHRSEVRTRRMEP